MVNLAAEVLGQQLSHFTVRKNHMPFPRRVGMEVSVTEPRNLCLTFQVVPMEGIHRELRDSEMAALIRFSRN